MRPPLESLGQRPRLLRRVQQSPEPLGKSAENRALMRRLDELNLEHPFYGSRQMAGYWPREGTVTGRHRVRRLIRPHAIPSHGLR